MTLHYKTQAIVLKKTDVNEFDRVFSVFTDNFGRLDIFGKAIRKIPSKLRSGIDIFSLSEIEFIQGKNRKTLTDAVATEKFSNIWQELEKFEVASKTAEVLDNFIKGQEKDQEIFNLLNETFAKLNNLESYKLKTISYKLVYYYFLWNALSLLGYRPEVSKCAICHQKLNPYYLYFSDKSGGIICKNCTPHDKESQKINSDIVKILRLILKSDWQTLSKLKLSQESQKLFKNISNNYYLYHLPQKI